MRSVVNPAMVEALQDTRWLTNWHRRLLMADLLKLPDQANHFGYGGHPAVLVSVLCPHGAESTEVAWVDVEIAELVWLLNMRHGLTTVESCQGDRGQGSFLAFKLRRHADEFLALAGDSLRGESRTRWGRDVWFGHLQLAGITGALRAQRGVITRAVESVTP